ncbi:MAG: thioredoxin family protein [Guyparkeria sp.]
MPSIPPTRSLRRLALGTLAPLAGLLLTGMAAAPGQADESAANADRDDVPLMSDLEHVEADLEYMQEEQIPMLLFFHATYCSYCQTVDDEFLQTMAESEEYDGRLIIRRVEIDSDEPEIEWQGTSYTPVEFARLQGVELVPEVIYFAPDGKQVVDELKGVTVPDFYPQYLDQRLRAAERCIDDPSLDVCTDGIDEPRRDLSGQP